ncbi:ATP-binding protein [Pseudomonas sp. KNUC1026]|uniref:ATP-binding protein n=1 Tax=Pseudomonas sp. KNUC1026 TaxID=2893890 RepID=UPI001F2C955E|nr:ATP-binding protein [Pseudomonas sp. KNUC1026]UFH51317.1 response regulator [Pseudomonas sp. KNUC1026]
MEALGNLTGGIAHDFNNLLMAVLGNLELLRKRLPADPSLQRLADNASAGAQRGAALIERMLAFARRQALRTQRLDPVALVHGMTELMQRTLGPTVTIHSELPAHLPWVDTDPNQLEAALLNLAVNARDAMGGQGRITLTGHVAPLAEGGLPHVCLAVNDTGAGMDERTLKRATEPFFTTKGVGEGSGLGLSMVLGLAEQSGGTLRLVSHPGQGTTAQIWLPACPPQAQPVEAANGPQLPPTPALQVLVVDDDPLVRDSTCALLASLGHNATVASSAEQALGLLHAGAFDLLLTDHAMPVRTGTQLAEQVRMHYPALPMLLVSGYSDVVAPPELRLTRLAKPFSRQQLAQAVHQALRTSEVCDE